MSLLQHRAGRSVLFSALYLSEGGPIGLVWWALPTLLRAEGIDVARITGLTASLVLPWSLKFLWAPLVDTLRTARWGYRSWIAAAQVAMGVTIIPLIWVDPATHFETWRILLLLHAFTAATQDVAIDAYAISIVPEHERGALNGSMQAGMLVGRSAFGGGALLVSATLGREWILGALVVCIWSSLGLLLASRDSSEPPPRRPLAEFREHLKAAATQRVTWFGLAFALTSAAAFESAGQLAGPFLLDHGVSQKTIGVFFGIVAVAVTLIGGILGGRLSDRWGRARSVGIFVVAFVAVVASLGVLDLTGAPPAAFLAGFSALYFTIGLFTAASYALFMDLTDPRIGGAHFSTYMSATNACEAWSGYAGGRITAQLGYGASFLILSAVSLASVPLVRRLRRDQ